jgi:hypothetical protein
MNSKEQFTRIANYVQEFSLWLCSISEDFSCTLLGKNTGKAVATFYPNIGNRQEQMEIPTDQSSNAWRRRVWDQKGPIHRTLR